MAFVRSIWVHQNNRKDNTIKVDVALKPSGSVDINVPVPEKFYKALLQIAQTAADAHEAQMRAEIISDELVNTTTPEVEGS